MSFCKNNILHFILGLLFISIISCKSNFDTVENSIKIDELLNLVDQENFIITFDVAYPRATIAMAQLQNTGIFGNGNSATRINLIGNPNLLIVKGDSVKAELPFYGERHMGAGYNSSDGGIKINEEKRDYKAIWNKKKNRYELSFNAKGNRENYDIDILISPSLNADMTITGTKRSSIRYTGIVSELEEPL